LAMLRGEAGQVGQPLLGNRMELPDGGRRRCLSIGKIEQNETRSIFVSHWTPGPPVGTIAICTREDRPPVCADAARQQTSRRSGRPSGTPAGNAAAPAPTPAPPDTGTRSAAVPPTTSPRRRRRHDQRPRQSGLPLPQPSLGI